MKNFLNDARLEIMSLRRENEVLRDKVEVMDLFALVLNMTPAYRSQGMAEDVARKLQKGIDKINANEVRNEE